jgi:hypothetical protein
MSHIDFIIALGITILTVSLIFSILNSMFSNEFSYLKEIELKESLLVLEEELFNPENGTLVSKFGKILCKFEETGNYSHTEEIKINLTPAVNHVYVFDKLFNEIPVSVYSLNNKTILTFSISFTPNEKKYFDIFYYGKLNDIEISLPNNTKAILVSGSIVDIVSQQKCADLNNVNYSDFKERIDFKHNFFINITNCSYGLPPPFTGSIITKKVPIIVETSDSLVPTEVRLFVW